MTNLSDADLDQVLRKLKSEDYTSIFFFLIDHITPSNYLWIIKSNDDNKKNYLKEVLRTFTNPKYVLFEILQTLKRFDLLKIIGGCYNKSQDYPSVLNNIWKSLFEICDNNIMILRPLEAIGGISFLKEDFPEVAIAEALCNEKISNADLEFFFNDLTNNCTQFSRPSVGNINDNYMIRSPTLESPCGLAVIFHHQMFRCPENNGPALRNRENSHLDVDSLNELWKSFGFKTKIFCDLKKTEVEEKFKELSKQDLSCYDVFITCYMSHGNQGTVYASDCKEVKISYLVDLMANKCKSLVNKAKLFFIQACQGPQLQSENSVKIPNFDKEITSRTSNIISIDHYDDPSQAEYPVGTSLFADVFIGISSIPGFVSFACEGTNCWFIGAVIKNMKLYGDKENFLDVMLKVTNEVSMKNGQVNSYKRCKQTVQQIITLRKKLQLKKLYA